MLEANTESSCVETKFQCTYFCLQSFFPLHLFQFEIDSCSIAWIFCKRENIAILSRNYTIPSRSISKILSIGNLVTKVKPLIIPEIESYRNFTLEFTSQKCIVQTSSLKPSHLRRSSIKLWFIHQTRSTRILCHHYTDITSSSSPTHPLQTNKTTNNIKKLQQAANFDSP